MTTESSPGTGDARLGTPSRSSSSPAGARRGAVALACGSGGGAVRSAGAAGAAGFAENAGVLAARTRVRVAARGSPSPSRAVAGSSAIRN